MQPLPLRHPQLQLPCPVNHMCRVCWFSRGAGQMSFVWMMNRPACTSPPFFGGEVGKYKHHA